MTRRGFTLIELMVTIAITAIMAVFAAPMLSDYIANARLREGGTALMAEALFAQSEAIKRNGEVRLSISGGTLRVVDNTTEGAGTLLRERTLPDGVTATAATSISFSGQGRTTDLEDYAVNLSKSGVTCSSEYRCPALLVDAGGGVRICKDRMQTC